MTPDFLAIGHVAKDLTPDGYNLGGVVTYGAVTAKRLGLRPAIVTSASQDVDLSPISEEMPVHLVPSKETTAFENTYVQGRRNQVIKGVGGNIALADIPPQWREAPLVLLGSLVREIDDELARSFPNAIVLAVVQGWLRTWDNEGRVSSGYWKGDKVLPHIHAAILSDEDISDISILDTWKDMVQVLIFTRGADGADIHFNGEWHHIQPFPARKEVDPTGAGDVFAAAYMVRYHETHDVLESARFASCVASFSIEAEGTKGIPSRPQVEARLKGLA